MSAEEKEIIVQDPSDLRPDFFEATKSGKDRQRLALACTTCRQKKVKCNGLHPRCDRCQCKISEETTAALDLECTYKLTTHRKTRKDNKRKLETESPEWPEVQIKDEDGRPVDPTARFALPYPLPSHKLLIGLCQVYFSRIYAQMYAFLHPPSFMRMVVEDPNSLNPILLLAISALSARFYTSAPAGTLTPDLWAAACVDRIFASANLHKTGDAYEAHNYLGRPSVSAVQALSLLSFHFFGQGQSSVAWMMSGFAVRMAHALHLNDEFHNDPLGTQVEDMHVTFRDREIRRRTFWAAFVMDRLNSAGENRPFTIRNDEIKIQLPISQNLFDRDVIGVTQALDGHVYNIPPALIPQDTAENMDCMAYLIRIVDLWGEVTCFVQNPGNEPQWEPNSTLMRLRARVLFWADSLPFLLRHNLNQTAQHPIWYIMHTAYFLALCIMHRFALSKGSQPYAIDHIPLPFVNICVKETLMNAQKVSEIIQSLPHNKISAPFMGYAAFSAATMHAFLGYHLPDAPSASVQQSRGYVQSALSFLQDLGRAWTPISKMYEALASQITHRNSPPDRCASILHDVGNSVPNFRVPESIPVQFSTQQQIEMNTLLFSNWFNNPTTQDYFDPSWTTPLNQFSNAMQASLNEPQLRRSSSREEAPYGAVPIMEQEAADLLVYFQDKSRPDSTTSKSRREIRVEIDFQGNLKEGKHSVACDILQLMKVGVITAENWT